MNCIFLLLILLCCGNGSGFVCGTCRERDRDDCKEERRGGCGCDNGCREERRGGCDCDNGCREERRGGCDNNRREERRGGCDCDNGCREERRGGCDCDNGCREERRGGCCGCEEARPFSGFPGQCPNTCGCE